MEFIARSISWYLILFALLSILIRMLETFIKLQVIDYKIDTKQLIGNLVNLKLIYPIHIILKCCNDKLY